MTALADTPIRELAAAPEQNPPVAEGVIAGQFTALLTAIVGLLDSVAAWWITTLPETVPDAVTAALLAVLVAANALIIGIVGTLPARRARKAQESTYPAVTVERYLLDAEAVLNAPGAGGGSTAPSTPTA